MEDHKRIKESLFLIEPNRIFAALRQNILYILIGMMGFTALGAYIGTKNESTSWSATSKIIRYNKQISQSSDVPYQFQDFNYETALETIRTRSNLVELIRRLDLNTSTTPESLYSEFEIKRGRNSDIVEIIFTSPNRELAAKGANILSEIFIDNFYTIQNAAIERIYDYYNKNKEEKVKDLYAAKDAMAAFLKKNNLNSLENEIEINYTLLNKLELEKLVNLTNITAYKTSMLSISDSLKDLPEEVKLRYAIRSANKKALELKQKELKRQKEVYTDIHPKIEMLQSEVDQIQHTINEAKVVEPDEITYGTNPMKSELRIMLSKTGIKYITAQNIEKSLNRQILSVKERLSKLTKLNKKFTQLTRQKDEAKEQLSIVSKRLYDLKMSIGSSKEDFKLFEPAKLPKFPKPSYKKMIVILFFILGTFVSITFIVARELLDNTVKTKFDLQSRFGITDTIQLPKENGISASSKQVFSFLANRVIGKKIKGAHIVTLGEDIAPQFMAHITSLLLEQLIYQKHRILHIKSSVTPYGHLAEHTIDLVSPLDTQTYTPYKTKENVDTLCWHIKDDYSIFIPKKEYLDNVFKTLKTLDYDYIIIDLPPYQEATHLVPMFAERTDTFLLCTEFNTSMRKVIHEFMLQLEEKSLDKMKGIISETHKYFLS